MQSNILIWVIYKIFTISMGMACIYMGYRLLIKGIFDGGTELTAAWSNNKKLIIKRASPGIVFALAGFGIIAINFLVSGYSFESSTGRHGTNNGFNVGIESKGDRVNDKRVGGARKGNSSDINCITVREGVNAAPRLDASSIAKCQDSSPNLDEEKDMSGTEFDFLQQADMSRK